ncbi:MAG TPA: DUF6134 family protein [Gemmatimonadaceae bacterium]|nr:DUF6134 family protein [Gemmatimonadaceae bacterium]
MSSRLAATAMLVGLQAAGLSAVAAAQARTVDEGTFVISRDGAPVGRESFRIVRNPPGAGEAYRATAQIAIGDRRIAPTLGTDSLGAPVSYAVAVQDGAEPAVRLQARARPGRFSALLQTRHGESAKEYIVQGNAVLLDDDVAHQLYFVALAGSHSGPLTIIDPRDGEQVRASLQRVGAEAVDIAGHQVPATRFSLDVAGVHRDFWIDAAGRVLKVTSPDRLTAVRDELPR